MSKNLILFFSCFFSLFAKAQPNENFIEINSFSAITLPKTILLYKKDIWCFVQTFDSIIAYKRTPENPNSIKVSGIQSFGSTCNRVQAKVENGKIFLLSQFSSELKAYSYEVSSNTWENVNLTSMSFSIGSNWEIAVKNNALYVGCINGADQTIVYKFDFTSNVVNTFDVTASLDDYTTSWTGINYSILFYIDNTNVYFGFSGYSSTLSDELYYAPISNLNTFLPYATGSPQFKKDGVVYNEFRVTIFGDNNNPPSIIVSDQASFKSYEKVISIPAQIDILSATATPMEFYLGDSDQQIVSKAGFHFALATMHSPGSSTVLDRNYIRRPISGGPWEINSGLLNVPGLTQFLENTMSITLNENSRHLGFEFLDQSTIQRFIFSNNTAIFSGSPVVNTQICGNNMNQIVSEIKLYNEDNDSLWISSITNNAASLTNAYAVYLGKEVSGGINVYKYAIYGFESQTSATPTLTITATDGYQAVNSTLVYTVYPTNVGVNFTSASIDLCGENSLVDLSNEVNGFNGGVFYANGSALPTTTFDPNPLLWGGVTTGLLKYETYLNGCFSKDSVPYVINEIGDAQIITVPAACGTNTGSASWIYSPANTETVLSTEWSTGVENATQIDLLASGQYYCELKLSNGCKIRGFGNVDPVGLIIAPIVTDVTCFNGNDGEIDLSTITGILPTSILWSNGYTGPTISNLVAGSYSATITDVTGCTATQIFIVDQPDQLIISNSNFLPNCGLSDGSISVSVTGGNTPYLYTFNGTPSASAFFPVLPAGIYSFNVTDNNGCVLSKEISLSNLNAAEYTENVLSQSCNVVNGGILLDIIPNLLEPLAVNNILWSNGEITEDINGLLAGNYSVDIVTGPNVAANYCHTFGIIEVPVKQPDLQDICVVTVDTSSTTNLIIWERVQDTLAISYYNIYRESSNTNEFLKIDAVGSNEISIFNDVIANPMTSSSRYRISAVDYCGVEGPKSYIHKTMVLNAIYNTGTTAEILWDAYEGTSDVDEYIVWRYTDQDGWNGLSPAVPIGTTSFTDLNVPLGATNLDYFVEMTLNSRCSAEKAQDFNAQRSNREKGSHFAGQGTGDENNSIIEVNQMNVSIYPNPVNDLLTLESEDSGLQIRLINTFGQLISTHITSKGMNVIDLKNLESGVYFIELKNDNQQKTIRIVKK